MVESGAASGMLFPDKVEKGFYTQHGLFFYKYFMIWIFYLLWFILKRKVSLPHVIFSLYLKYSHEMGKYCTGLRETYQNHREVDQKRPLLWSLVQAPPIL